MCDRHGDMEQYRVATVYCWYVLARLVATHETARHLERKFPGCHLPRRADANRTIGGVVGDLDTAPTSAFRVSLRKREKSRTRIKLVACRM